MWVIAVDIGRCQGRRCELGGDGFGVAASTLAFCFLGDQFGRLLPNLMLSGRFEGGQNFPCGYRHRQDPLVLSCSRCLSKRSSALRINAR